MLDKSLKDLLLTLRYYIVYLPEEIPIDTSQCKRINLNFKIKLSDNVVSHINSNILLNKLLLEITGKFIQTANRYKEVIIKLVNKTEYFSFKFPENKEIARLYLFTTPRKKIYTIYKQNQ